MAAPADSPGRVLIGYADGCTGTCDSDQAKPCDDKACDSGPTASTDHHASIARLSCGRGLVASQDPALACATSATATAPSPASTVAAAARPGSSVPGLVQSIPNTPAPAAAGGTLPAAPPSPLLATGPRRRAPFPRGGPRS